MKANPQLPEVRLVNEAVRRSINPALPNHFSGAGTGAYTGIEGSSTVAIESGDDILDGHFFHLMIDSLDDAGAYLGQLP